MMLNYKSIRIGDVGKIVTGKTPKTKERSNYGNEFMFIGPVDLRNNYFIENAEKMLSEKGINSIKGSIIDGLSIVVGCIGWDMGNVALVHGKCATNQQINSITNIKEKYNPFYIYYWLTNKKNFLFKIANVTRTPILNKSDFSNIIINIPEKGYQDLVANFLKVLDSKIEINNRINSELEAMAKLIYDYWFVQFDFPISKEQAKAMGKPELEGKPYKSSGGKMVFNEELKREIPEGWEVNPISYLIEKDKSGDWGKEEKEGNYTENVFCIRGADINGINGKGQVKAPERYILEKNTHKLLETGDLVIEISGGSPTQSTGRMTFLIDETFERFSAPLICSNFCKALRLKDIRSLYNFAFEWNRLYDAGVFFGWEGKTSGIKNFLFESFTSKYKINIPPLELMEEFYEKMNPIFTSIQKNLKQNQELSSLRDWLLPMLMNGQVKVATKSSETKEYSMEQQRVSKAAEGKEVYGE